jgi:DNA-binding transcriptional ArsR family regulator
MEGVSMKVIIKDGVLISSSEVEDNLVEPSDAQVGGKSELPPLSSLSAEQLTEVRRKVEAQKAQALKALKEKERREKESVKRRKEEAERPPVTCIYCNIQVSQSKLIQHMAREHGIVALTLTQAIAINTTPGTLVECPHCKTKLRIDRLQRHIEKKHSKR